MATLDQINQGILAAAQKGDVESAKTLKAARDALMSGGGAPAPPQPSIVDRFVKFADDAGQGAQNFVSKYGRPLATGAGAIAGGIIGAPEAALAAVPTAGLGGIATEAGAMGLGGAIGGNLYDMATGRRQKLAQQLATTVQDVAGNAAAAPAGRLAGAAVDAAAPYVAPAAQKVAAALSKAGPAVKSAITSLPSRTASLLDAGSTAASNDVRSSALAKVLAQSQAADQAAAQAASLKAADVPLRSAMQDAADAQAAKGVAISDIPEAKALVQTLEAKVNPPGEIGTILLPDQVKPYQQVIDTLSPQNGPKPNLESIQNLRRAIAKPAYTGDQTGYNAIPKGDRKDIVSALNAVEDAYTGGLQAPVQANYSAALAAQKQADVLGKMKNALSAQSVQLSELPPSAAAQKAQEIVSSLAKKGIVSESDYRDFMQLSNAATTAQTKAKLLKALGLSVGGGLVGAEALHMGGNVLGMLK